MRKIVSFLERHRARSGLNPRYALTTNGSFITPKVIGFLNRYRFFVELSFDGLAQESHRPPGSFRWLERTARDLLTQPHIRLEINSVFTPQSVGLLAASLSDLMGIGLRDIRFSLSLIQPWRKASLEELQKELRRLRKLLELHYRDQGSIPIVNFRGRPAAGLFACSAGKDRLAVATDGTIWGCHLFPDLLHKVGCSGTIETFSFGRLGQLKDLESDYAEVLKRYAGLAQDSFTVRGRSCLFCPEFEACEICPLQTAFTGKKPGDIPFYICRIQRLQIAENKIFRENLARLRGVG